MESTVNSILNNKMHQNNMINDVQYKNQSTLSKQNGNAPNSAQSHTSKNFKNFNQNYKRDGAKSQTQISNAASIKKKTLNSNVLNQNFIETEQNNKKRNTQKAKTIRRYKLMLKYNDTSAAILGIVGLFFAIIEYEIFFDDTGKQRYSSTNTSTIYRAMVTITTAVVLFLLIIHSFIAFKLSLEKGSHDSQVGYFSSSNFKQLILELIVIGIHCPPNYDNTINIRELDHEFVYSIDGCMMCWMLLRFYLVFRLFAQYSKWTNELAEECCEPEGCEANTIFAMKATLKEKPFTSLLALMIISCVIFGLAVRHFERPFYEKISESDVDNYQDYSYIWNGMWLIMITMMTVGYGDFYPKTHMGRFVCILACFWGVFLVSMMVVTLTVVSSFDSKQRRAYDILFRLNIKEEIKKKAAFVITLIIRVRMMYCRYAKGKLTYENYLKERINILSKMDIKLQFFRDLRAQISDYEITSEESLRQLTEKIDRDLDDVKTMLNSLIEIEKQLSEIEQSQNIVIIALNECINYTNNLEEFIIRNEEGNKETCENNKLNTFINTNTTNENLLIDEKEKKVGVIDFNDN